MSIMDQINELIANGNTTDNILVNDGNSAWGDSCAVTIAQAAELRAEWQQDGQDVSDLPVLTTAREWMARG